MRVSSRRGHTYELHLSIRKCTLEYKNYTLHTLKYNLVHEILVFKGAICLISRSFVREMKNYTLHTLKYNLLLEVLVFKGVVLVLKGAMSLLSRSLVSEMNLRTTHHAPLNTTWCIKSLYLRVRYVYMYILSLISRSFVSVYIHIAPLN